MGSKSDLSESVCSEVPVVESTRRMILRKPLGNVPFTKAEQRKKLLNDAGISKAVIARITKKAVDRLDEALDATKKTYSASDGQITDERTDPDFAIRAKAATQVLEFADALPSKQEGLLPGKVQVEVKFPDWAKPRKTIDVQSKVVSE